MATILKLNITCPYTPTSTNYDLKIKLSNSLRLSAA